jgi:hypothetical protein
MTEHAQAAYAAFRGGFRSNTHAIPPWEDLEPWMRDMVKVAYLQGKLDSSAVVKAPKKAKPYRTADRIGILNPYGGIWTDTTFRTEAEAMAYVECFWRGNENAPNLSKFKPVKVRVTVTCLDQ